MMRLARFGIAFALSLALGVVPLSAWASGGGIDSIAGIETGASCSGSSCVSGFVGIATGSIPGGWTATVDRTDLTTITGGSFTLVPASGKLTGSFAKGGTITPIQDKDDSAICPDEASFAVKDLLSGAVNGNFSVTLTHYNVEIFGTCVTYFATVTGTVTFS